MLLYVVIAFYIASVLTVLAALFLPGRRLRAAAAILGTVSIWMPLLILRTSLGLPYADASPGSYQILGSQLDADGQHHYVLLEGAGGFTAPRLYSLPVAREEGTLKRSMEMERNPYAFIGSGVEMGPGGALNVLGMPGEAPDWDKDKYYENPAPFLVRPTR